ncbi:hypothetical protein MUG91_G165n20 [Manis pentadactyla]|nr:hypothetical protein MUG91_G165n20 [Manis pentadactyla]
MIWTETEPGICHPAFLSWADEHGGYLRLMVLPGVKEGQTGTADVGHSQQTPGEQVYKEWEGAWTYRGDKPAEVRGTECWLLARADASAPGQGGYAWPGMLWRPMLFTSHTFPQGVSSPRGLLPVSPPLTTHMALPQFTEPSPQATPAR